VWIEINIERFDQEPDGQVVLIAEIAVEGGRGHAPIATTNIRLEALPNRPGARELVSVMSRLLGKLADRVANAVAKKVVLF
jgi:uncharacterized lipoprotein YmbA